MSRRLHLIFFLALGMAWMPQAWAVDMDAFLFGTYYTGGSVTIAGDINNPQGQYDVNLFVYNKDLNKVAHIDRVTTDANGFFSRSYSDLNAQDYNAWVRDLNHDLNSFFDIVVEDFAKVDINFIGKSPPYQKDANILFTLRPKDENDRDINGWPDLNVVMLNALGQIVDSNMAVKQRRDANFSYDVNLIASQAGQLVISINEGFEAFLVPVYSFRTYVSTLDDQNNAESFYATGDNVQIQVRLTSFDNNQIYSGTDANVDINVEKPDGNISQLSDTAIRGLYQANFSPSLQGTHTVRVKAQKGSDTQTAVTAFTVGNYEMSISSKKNANAGKKERFPAVFAGDTNAQFAVTYTNLSTDSKLDENVLDDVNGGCTKAKFKIKRKKTTEATETLVPDGNFNVAQNGSACDLNVYGPSTLGSYIVAVEVNDVNLNNTLSDLTASTSFLVQNFVIFFDAVDPSTFSSDPNRAGKFAFFKDENVGFRPTVIGLIPGEDANVSAVNGATLLAENGERSLSPSYLDFNADGNLLTVRSTAFTDNNVQDGIVSMQFTVNVNAKNNLYDADSITAFGAFEYKSMTVTVEAATDANGSTKSEMFGPSVFKADENIFLTVTAQDSTGNAVKYATVSVAEIRNVEFWEDVNVQDINTGVTNSNGVATLSLGNLGSGGYFVKVNVSKSGNIGVGETFLIVKNYIVFAEPFKFNSDTNSCEFQHNLGLNDDVNLMLQVMDPATFTRLGDFNILGITVFKEGGDDFFETGSQVDANFNLSTVRCRFFGPSLQDQNVLHITRSLAWEPGFYRIGIRADSVTKGRETGIGFFQAAAFRFEVNSVGFGEGEGGEFSEDQGFGEDASPGTWFDFNVFSDKNVNLLAELEDDKTFSLVDANLELRRGTVDLNANPGNDVNAFTNTSLRVHVPAATPAGQYVVLITASSTDGEKVEGEFFLNVSSFKLIVPRSSFWNSGGSNMRYTQSFNGQPDTNIMDNLLASAKYMATADVNGLTYDRWIDNGLLNSFEKNDFNRLVLVNTSTGAIYVDLTDDGNFQNDGSSPYTKLPEQSMFDINLIKRASTGEYIEDNTHPILANVMVTDFEPLKYLKVPTDLNLTRTQNTWIGSYNKDKNIHVPVLIKRGGITPVSGATVTVSRVFQMSFGFGPPTPLAASLYQALSDTTDVNGLGFPIVKISTTGNFMLELTVTEGATSETFFPWESPMFEVIQFDTHILLAKNRMIQFDNNNPIADLNVQLPPGTYHNDFYGFYNETAHGYDLDNDGNTDENWYMVRLNDTGRSSFDGNVILDDDRYIDFSYGSFTDNGTEGGKSIETVLGFKPWNACLSDFNASSGQNDCRVKQGRYTLNNTDLNAQDANTFAHTVLIWEQDENNNYQQIWDTNRVAAGDANIHLLVEVRKLAGDRNTAVSGTATVNVFSSSGGFFTLVTTGASASIQNGVALVNLQTLSPGSYGTEVDINADGTSQRAFGQFRVK